jgi:hypothetical protein
MDAELKLTNMMQMAAGRYVDLKAAFRRYRGAAREAFASNVRYAPIGVVVGEVAGNQRFAVEFAGRTIWLVLALRLDESETAIGQITCLMQHAEHTGDMVVLGRFTLGKLGDTSLDAPDRLGEKINVFEPAGAGYVVLHCLRLALKKDPE